MTRAVRRLLAAVLGCGLLLGACLSGSILAPATAAHRCPQPSLKQAIKDSDVVFRGVVTDVRPVNGKNVRFRTYKVTADRFYKSSLVTQAVTVSARAGVRCPLPALHQGSRYIFFATGNRSRLVASTATARASHPFTAQVVKRLGNGKPAQTPPPPAATFTTVAGARPTSLTRLLAPGAAVVILCLLGLVLVGRSARRV